MSRDLMISECESCKEERKKKNLPPVKKVRLPDAITAKGFRKPKEPIWVCPYCCPPETPIWMGDGHFKDLGDITVGDTVMGWIENHEGLDNRSSRKLVTTENRKIPTTRLYRATVVDIFERKS